LRNGELEVVDTTDWLPKVMRKDDTIGLSPMASGPDPDQNLYLNYGCGGELNYNGYRNPAVDELNGLYGRRLERRSRGSVRRRLP
jgi:peptide/nickel transport system substrate-binding protein